MEMLHAVLLVVGGLAVAAPHERLAPVRAFFAAALAAFALAALFQGLTRPFRAPPLVAVAAVGATYGALLAVLGVVAPTRVPRALQLIFGIICVAAGVLLLLFRFRVLQPR